MSKRVLLSLFLIVVICLGGLAIGGLRTTENASAETMCGRTVFADVVALDQDFYYNRLGAINANGMIYALARDVVVNDPAPAGFTAGQPLSELTNAERFGLQGQVSLRADKRPRPIVLRMNAGNDDNPGDCLEINFTNLLHPQTFLFDLPGDFPITPILGLGQTIPQQVDDQPITREASIHVDGLNLMGDIGSDGSNVGANDPGSLVAPGGSTTYTYYAANEGTHLAYSMGSTLGAEGGGGTRAYGLFGAVNVQPRGAEWYRSQLTRQEMDWATPPENGVDTNNNATTDDLHRTTPDGQPILDYDAVYPTGTGGGKDLMPIVAMLAPKTGYDGEIVHTDINAVITGPGRGLFGAEGSDLPTENKALGDRTKPFREFTVIFHDESKTVQAFPGFFNDPVLKHTLHGVKDGFPINYGSGGIGSEIIANRLGVGPMWDCAECKYEEFFLTSFTVGDPAMVVDIPANFGVDGDAPWLGPKATMALYPDDPSNVHHSYMNDRVIFRNLHAGPKEHHIFHLHAHQWLFNPNDTQSNYLDGQALGPGSGYSYEIAYGGSGNRNKTVGDSIFHCHFYPHFAQGMWEMWRTHDVFEQGTVLDAAALAANPAAGKPALGARALPDGEIPTGTPIPGVVPLPQMAMAPMPDADATIVASDLNGDAANTDNDVNTGVDIDTNGDGVPDLLGVDEGLDSSQWDLDANGTADFLEGFPAATNHAGYPFFNPGVLGHRPPTPALDIMDDGGLPRHVVTSGPDEGLIDSYVSRLDFNKVLHEAAALQIPEEGTPAEQQAMAFHAGPIAGGGDATYDSFLPDGMPSADFEVNGLPAAAGAPFADPCRTDVVAGNVSPITTNRTIKGANIEMPVTLNRVGWHFQQQRFEALWEDVGPTLSENKAPEPMIMRMNSTDCGEFHHTNLVPNVYELDDYQVRTPTDIIGQHIHLVKFDVMSADGSANGWNYEDGTLSPDEVRERIEAFNHGGGFTDLNGDIRDELNNPLKPAQHPWFSENTLADFDPTTGVVSGANIYVCADAAGTVVDCKLADGSDNPAVEAAGPDLDGTPGPDQNWLGARTTIQRWYADPLLERSWDGGVGTVFTHDHYGPSTHQQVGLYSTLLIEPEGSVWKHNEWGYELGDVTKRGDGGPTTWQAIIEVPEGLWTDLDGDNEPDDPTHREFYFEFADFQHAYEAGGGALNDAPGVPNEQIPALVALGIPGIDIPSYADFPNAINPSFKQVPPLLEDIYIHPNLCPGNVPRPCPEAISADDPGTYAVNFRNEPIALRVFEDANLNGQLDAGEDTNGNGVLDQVAGDAGDLALAFQSRTDRAIPELNSQPAGPYPPLTADMRPGDPWTPLLRAYMGDRLRIRVQVGAHEEEHNFTLHGMKWRQEANGSNSGWKNSEFFGIDEYFNVDTPVLPDTGRGTPNEVDYFYTVGSEVEGIWNGVWGILRTYKAERNQGDLVELRNNDVGSQSLEIVNNDDPELPDFNGVCPADANLVRFNVTSVRAADVLGDQGLVYNSRTTAVDLVTGINAQGTITASTPQGQGPLIDPTALMYVLDDDLVDPANLALGLKPGTPVEPLILRVNAGDCIEVQLTNALPAEPVFAADGVTQIGFTGQPKMPGFSAFPPIVHKNENADLAGGITTFNYNDMAPSSYVGLHPQLLAFDPRNNDGFTGGQSDGKLVAPGSSAKYTWYAGDVTATNLGTVRGGRIAQYELAAEPVEFGAVGLFPADRIQGTSKGLVGAMVVEPQNSCWITDPGTRAQASVWKADGLSGACNGAPAAAATFRDFVTVMHNDVNLRYGGGACAGDPSAITCAVPNISAEGPLGPPEDPQDSGQKAINYGADPLWFRLGIAPNTPFDLIHRIAGLKDLIPNVFSNSLAGVLGDPQTEVYAASPVDADVDGLPDTNEGRVRLLMPGGHARGTTYTLHGHEWQRQPYRENSSVIGHNDSPGSEYYGTQEGINPAGHWDIVTDLGGYFDVAGDYLFRDQASFGSYQGLWGLLRFNYTPPKAANDFYSVLTVAAPGVLANDLDLDGDALIVGTVNELDTNVGTLITLATGSTLTVLADGSFTYVPTTGFIGEDSFTYQASAGGELSNEATVFITVRANIPPVANDDPVQAVVEGPVTIDVLANDTDADGDPLTIVAWDTPSTLGGTVDCASGVDCTYTPPTSAAVDDIDSFTYTIDDAHGGQDTATVTITFVPNTVTVTSAIYRTRQERWQIAGTVSPSTSSVEVFLNGQVILIGAANVNNDGAWNFNGTSDQVAVDGNSVIAVSSSGAFSDPPFLVDVRNN